MHIEDSSTIMNDNNNTIVRYTFANILADKFFNCEELG